MHQTRLGCKLSFAQRTDAKKADARYDLVNAAAAGKRCWLRENNAGHTKHPTDSRFYLVIGRWQYMMMTYYQMSISYTKKLSI